MGFFDSFISPQNNDNNKRRRVQQESTFQQTQPNFYNNTESSNNLNCAVIEPTSFDDVESVINLLKAKRQVYLKLAKVKETTAIRIMDMLCGAIYALDGGVARIDENVYLFSPNGIKVDG